MKIIRVMPIVVIPRRIMPAVVIPGRIAPTVVAPIPVMTPIIIIAYTPRRIVPTIPRGIIPAIIPAIDKLVVWVVKLSNSFCVICFILYI
mgnify:CR=1 FL=1